MSEPCRMILDVDTGIDDAMAILYALRRPGIRLEALTTTFGNTDIDTATRNTLRILELAGRADVPVARGPGRSLLKPVRRRRRSRPRRRRPRRNRPSGAARAGRSPNPRPT